MDPLTLSLILAGIGIGLPILGALFGGGAQRIEPIYPWTTELGREISRAIGGVTPQMYPGQLTLPITPTEQALAQALAQPLYLAPAQDYIARALAGEYLRPEAQPFLRAMEQAVRSAGERATRRALEDMAGQLQRANIPGGSAEGVLRQRVAESVAQQTAGQLAQLYGGIYEAERQRQQALLPIYLQYALAPGQQALAGLQAQQYLRQAMLQNILLPYQEWQRYRQEQLLPLQLRLQLIGQPAYYPQYRMPDWYYWITPLSEAAMLGAGYAAGRRTPPLPETSMTGTGYSAGIR